MIPAAMTFLPLRLIGYDGRFGNAALRFLSPRLPRDCLFRQDGDRTFKRVGLRNGHRRIPMSAKHFSGLQLAVPDCP